MTLSLPELELIVSDPRVPIENAVASKVLPVSRNVLAFIAERTTSVSFVLGRLKMASVGVPSIVIGSKPV